MRWLGRPLPIEACLARRAAACLAASLGLAIASAAEPPAPGTYLTEGGWGRLTLAERAGQLMLVLRTTGPNGHGCGLQGPVDAQGLARIPPGPGMPACVVQLRPTARPGELEVSPGEAEACRAYCGARAGGFEGLYRLAVPGCSPAERQRARQAFQRQYAAAEFEAATATLGPVLARCAAVLPALEAAWLRNDLALAHDNAGQRAACLQLLAPLRAQAARTEAEVRAELPPSDAQAWLRVMRATRTNLARCAG